MPGKYDGRGQRIRRAAGDLHGLVQEQTRRSLNRTRRGNYNASGRTVPRGTAGGIDFHLQPERRTTMNRSSLMAVLAGLLLAAGGAPAAETPRAEDGLVPMFDGKTLKGWQTTGNWIVEEDGAVTLKPRPGETGWQRYDAYLTTQRKYKNFVLDLEFKIEKGGNSGVFLRVGDPKDQVKSGFEIQILDTHGLANPGNHDCGGVIGAAAPSKNMAKPAGQWNRYVISCVGNRLKVEMNGEQIHDLELDKSAIKDRPLEGHIGFQDEAKRVWYRNVRIKELK